MTLVGRSATRAAARTAARTPRKTREGRQRYGYVPADPSVHKKYSTYKNPEEMQVAWMKIPTGNKIVYSPNHPDSNPKGYRKVATGSQKVQVFWSGGSWNYNRYGRAGPYRPPSYYSDFKGEFSDRQFDRLNPTRPEGQTIPRYHKDFESGNPVWVESKTYETPKTIKPIGTVNVSMLPSSPPPTGTTIVSIGQMPGYEKAKKTANRKSGRKSRRKSKSYGQAKQERGRDFSILSSSGESTKPRKKSGSLSNLKQASVFGPRIRI